MIYVCAGIVELHCSVCGALIPVGDDSGYVELAELNLAEHEHQFGHLVEEHKEMEALG